jgi:hypothetical protein
VVVAASELEFSLAKSTVLETPAGDEAVREAFDPKKHSYYR